jgi:hypothetical protein
MANIKNHSAAATTKLLFIGDSGAGKTGALASLASAGYNLRIMDFDNGLDVLKNLLLDPKSPYDKGSADRVEYITLTEKMKNVGGKAVPVKADVWQRAMTMLNHWKEVVDGQVVSDLGPITTWTTQDVLVIDSLSGISQAAMNFILSMTFQGDWGLAQNLVEPFLQMLYSDAVVCNVVVNCHITYIGDDNNMRGYPNTLGKALPPKVGRYFNSMLLAKSTGQGTATKRRILTNVTGVLDLKNTAPLRVASEYDLSTGLADYFKAVRAQ